MQNTPNQTDKTLHYPLLNPRINAGALLGRSTLDELSFAVGLMCERMHDGMHERWSN